MTHEFKNIVDQARRNQKNGLKSVLATVVHLEGSSYRKPGVRMLISEDLKMTGAVSGGCVEAEVRRRAKPVIHDGQARIMTYDGRYRLGCEGTLFILIEPFHVTNEFYAQFMQAVESRETFHIDSHYQLEDEAIGSFGSILRYEDGTFYPFNKVVKTDCAHSFPHTLKPSLKLLIIGAEHDSVKLCAMASLLGWEVDVVSSLSDPKKLSDFPGARSVISQSPELIDFHLDNETVVVLMTHSYTRDLKYLLKLAEHQPKYLGILGSRKRRDQLENDLLEYKDDLNEEFLSSIFSPAGLNIGAITPEEIAVSILSEVLTVVRNKEPLSLRDLATKIHS